MENIAQVRVNGTINPVNFDINSNYEVCLSKNMIDSKFLNGLWCGDSPFHSVLPITLLQIFLFLISNRLIYLLLRPIRTPNFVCSVLAGILLGPSVVEQNKKLKNLLFPPIQAEILWFLASMGVAYYIFIVIMKMEAISNLKNAIKTWKIGTMPFLCGFWVMSGLFFLFPNVLSSKVWTVEHLHMLLCLTASVSTFPVMSENLVELNLLTSELGQIAISATALNEIAQWIFIAISVVSNYEMNTIWGFLCSCVAYICFYVFVIKPTMLKLSRRTTPGMPLSQGYVILIQIGVLTMGALSNLIGMSFILGPFIVGLVMPHGSTLATTVVARTEAIISHFLVPLFFCYIGLNIDIYALQSWDMIFKIQLIIIAGFVTKLVVCMLISVLSYNIRLKHGIVLGLMLNYKGIIDLIIFVKYRRLKVVDDQLFAQWVFSVIGITATVSPLIEILYKPLTRVESSSRSGASTTIRTIQNTSRYSELCMVSCVHKEGEVRSMISLLESINPFQANPICVYVVHLIELLGQSTPVLRRVDMSKKKFLLTHPSTSSIMRAFDNYARNSGEDGFIALVPYINVAPYKNMHESICNLAQDLLAPLIIIPFHQNDPTYIGGLAATIRKVNMKFMAHARCTVGILVDRHSHLRVNNTSDLMSLHIGIFFMGGADDREALALGMRMAERQNSSLEVFRFVVDNQQEEEEDRRMDESLIDEFRAMNFGRAQVKYREINVEEGSKVFEMIRRVEGKYDLVMVGRKHTVETGGFGDEEVLSNLLDNADMLGAIGDMLASKEFCDGMVPVLVTQCGGNKLKGHARKASSVAGSHSSFGSRFW